MTTAQKMTRDRKLVWALSITLVVVLVLLIAALTKPDGTPSASDQNPSEGTGNSQSSGEVEPERPRIPDLSRRVANDPAAIGSVDAPLVLIEYADYRCPYCGVFAREALPSIVKEYVDEGLLRVEWRDMPIFGDESFAAAVATRAAGNQGMFWEYSDAIFAYKGSGHQDLPEERLLEIATEIGVPDVDQFAEDLENAELISDVYKDMTEGMNIGVNSTPTFIIGQSPVMGAQSVEVFRQIIEAELLAIQNGQ